MTKISQTTNSQTSILAEDAFSNEAEQSKLRELFKRHNPPFFYAPKRGIWEQQRATEKRLFMDKEAIFGRHLKLTSKELAAVCLAIFGEPESAKDKPRVVFERPGGKKSVLYDRIFTVNNVASQWLLPVQLFRYINAFVKDEASKNPDSDRVRIAQYGRFRMLHLAYGWLKEHYAEDGDFLDSVKSDELFPSMKAWAPTLLGIVLDGIEDAFKDAQDKSDSSGLREFFREKRHQPQVLERFRRALANNERLAQRNGQSLSHFIGLAT